MLESSNNLCENLVVTSEEVNENGEKCLVCFSPNQEEETQKQVTVIGKEGRRSGKHCYFSGY